MNVNSLKEPETIPAQKWRLGIRFVATEPMCFKVTTNKALSAARDLTSSHRPVKKVPSPARPVGLVAYAGTNGARPVPVQPHRSTYSFVFNGLWCGDSHG